MRQQNRQRKNDWTASMPVFVTRPTAGGETGSLNISIWMGLLILLLVWLNLIIWSVIGLIKAVGMLF